jgi:hypothetical protein
LWVFMVLTITMTEKCSGMNWQGLVGGIFHGVRGDFNVIHYPSERSSHTCSSLAMLEFFKFIFD